MQRTSGQQIETQLDGETVRAFVPAPLPPSAPDLILDDALASQLELAREELSRLGVVAQLGQSAPWLSHALVRRSAVASARLAGARCTLADLLHHESRDELDQRQAAAPDIQEACNHIEALSFARSQLTDPEGLPLSLRLIREIHARLLRRGRGEAGRPGEFRTITIPYRRTRRGATPAVPPPPNEMDLCLADLESYLHTGDGLAPLVRIALIHGQLLLIHPFLDGNSRVARVLIPLLLERWCGLAEPVLLQSQFFLEHREEYRARLLAVRREGEWEGWIWFFLEGVITMAREAVHIATDLIALLERDRERVLAAERGSLAAARLLQRLPVQPMITAPGAARLLQTSKPTAGKAVEVLVTLGVLREISGRRRDRRYEYSAFLDRLGRDDDLEY